MYVTYPEIYVEVSTPTEFTITDLEGHGHLVVFVELLVETFPRMRTQLDVVCLRQPCQTAQCC